MNKRRFTTRPCSIAIRGLLAMFVLLVFVTPIYAQSGWVQPLLDTLWLEHYNTRLVITSTMLLGVAGGLVGTFLLLRRQSLMGDALSHATFPGVALAFFVLVALGGTGKSLPALLLGATITGLLGLACVMAIHMHTRLKEDAAMGIVLSVFYGIGVALYGIVQQMPGGSAAGLRTFIYGKTASLLYQDFLLIAGVCVLVILLTLVFYKGLQLLCFDRAYAKSLGWPVLGLDAILLGLVTAVTVTGLQAVGLILVIALLIIPSAAARFWTDRLSLMLIWAGVIGGVGGWMGTAISATFPRMPAGAIIVLVLTAIFAISMVFGWQRGVLFRWLAYRHAAQQTDRQHLLRGIYEWMESKDKTDIRPAVPLTHLQAMRSWSTLRMRKAIRRAERDGLLLWRDDAHIALTPRGQEIAMQFVRNHRLWEMYMIAYADAAPGVVDHYADRVEHVLAEPIIRKLERLLAELPEVTPTSVPQSPHLTDAQREQAKEANA